MNITLKIKDVGFRRSDMSSDVQITGFTPGDQPLQLFRFTTDRVALRKFLDVDSCASGSCLEETTLPGKSA